MTRISAVRVLTLIAPATRPSARLQEPRRHVAVGDQDTGAAKLAVQRLLHGFAVRHRQHIGADVMHLLDGVIAVLVLQEADAEAVELLDDLVAVLGVFIDRLLIDDAVIGDGDFLGVLLRRRVAGNDGVVQPVHAHRDRARALDVGLLEQNDIGLGIFQLGLQRRHRPGRAAADHQHIAGHLRKAVDYLIHRHHSLLNRRRPAIMTSDLFKRLSGDSN